MAAPKSDCDSFSTSSNSSDSEQELTQLETLALAIIAVVTVCHTKQKMRKKPTMWRRTSLLQRPQLGAYATVSRVLQGNNEKAGYSKFIENNYEYILSRVVGSISKEDMRLRKAMSPEEILVVTLRFLASGMSYQDLESYHKISKSSLSAIIPETCEAIYEALKDDFLKAGTS